jgi:hypothetical protein
VTFADKPKKIIEVPVHAPFGCVLVIFARPMYLEIERVGRKVIA